MRRSIAVALGLALGLVQICLHGFGIDVVVPNLVLVAIVFLSPRLSFASLGAVAVAAGVMLETSSAAPIGTHILGLLLLVLVAKLLLRSTDEESRFWYLYGILISGTIGYSLALGLTIPFRELQVHWGVLTTHILLECLYNSVLFGICMAVGARQVGGQKQYRLPH